MRHLPLYTNNVEMCTRCGALRDKVRGLEILTPRHRLYDACITAWSHGWVLGGKVTSECPGKSKEAQP